MVAPRVPRNVSRRMVLRVMLLQAMHPLVCAAASEGVQAAFSYFLLPGDFDIDSLRIDPPPKSDADEARKVLHLRSQVTATRIDQIKAQAIDPIPLFWQCAGLNVNSYPPQARRIQEAVVDTEQVVIQLKRHFSRRRPNAVLPDIDPVVPVPPYASYPSGHATQAVVIAELMSVIVPSAAERLRQLATQVGRNREFAGLHYPSDTDAGFRLGRDLSQFFLQV